MIGGQPDVTGVRIVPESTLIGALEAVTGDSGYDDPGGWGELTVSASSLRRRRSQSTAASSLESPSSWTSSLA